MNGRFSLMGKRGYGVRVDAKLLLVLLWDGMEIHWVGCGLPDSNVLYEGRDIGS